MRVVLDANVLVSGLFWSGYPSRILELWVHDRIVLLASVPILDEYSRVLSELANRAGHTALARQWIVFIGQHCELIRVRTAVHVCRDPDDDKYLACAVDGKADVVVSGDKDLVTLRAFGGIPILTPRRFLASRG